MRSSTKARLYSVPVSVLSLALVLWAWHTDSDQISPGPLSAVHAQDPRLAGREGCRHCHGTDGQPMATSCLACHEPISRQIEQQTGLHGQLADVDVTQCALCHSEHHGEEFQLVSTLAFDQVGVPDVRLFTHAGLEFRLTGKHQHAACQSCHSNAAVELLPPGQTRFLGLTDTCTHCHQDVHQGTFGNDCAACHGESESFVRVANFQHTHSFPLIGVHGTAKCRDCHPPETVASVASLVSIAAAAPSETNRVRTCAECHASPHREAFLALVSASLGTEEQQSCVLCHPSEHSGFQGSQVTFDPKLHALTGFPLTPPHEHVDCQKCHAGFGTAKADRAAFAHSYPGRAADDCKACHGDPHQGAFTRGPFRDSDCLACHQRDSFKHSTLTAQRHHETGFALSPAHQKVGCDRCHPRLAAGFDVRGHSIRLLRFEKTPTDCRGCHRDPHLGQFLVGLFRDSDCNACHSENSFRPTTFDVKAHARTSFSLTGAHQAVACSKCHAQHFADVAASGSSRTARAFHGTPSQCVNCHADVHAGLFDRPGLITQTEGRTDCARCHNTHRFDDVPAETFDHGYWTGYPLVGQHAAAKCVRCHSPTPRPDEQGRTFGRARGRNCQSCHQDPHLGQFGSFDRVDCTRCHSAATRFRDVTFNHQTDSRFPLDRKHARLPCAKCHRSYPLPGGKSVIRFKPLGTKCGDCHAAPTSKSR